MTDITRDAFGQWHQRFHQQKAGVWKHDYLWPEIDKVIDTHILGGRPARQAQRQYEELAG